VIRAVISDFGGVLTTPLAGSFQEFADQSGVDMAAFGKALAALREHEGAHPLHELECGRMTEGAFVESLQSELSTLLGREVTLASFTETLFAGLAPNEPMIALMADLRAEGYRMALLTNNVREWESRWRAVAPIEELFEVVIDSAFVGMRKPEPEIYEHTVACLGVPAAECLFIDDLESNCVAAQAAGMTAIVYREPAQAIADVRAALNGSGGDGGPPAA
jgi:putative hydrolase of the HAD superfamily